MRSKPKRPLSRAQAGRCEHAKTKRCRCRCGGAFHGKGRVANVEELPAGDPHHAKPKRQLRLFEG